MSFFLVYDVFISLPKKSLANSLKNNSPSTDNFLKFNVMPFSDFVAYPNLTTSSNTLFAFLSLIWQILAISEYD